MAIFVYRLRCSDGADSIGSHRGDDVANRVADHNAGYFPKARRPAELAWAEAFTSILDAILKGWRRAKKEALIRGDWILIQELARGGTPRPSTRSG